MIASPRAGERGELLACGNGESFRYYAHYQLAVAADTPLLWNCTVSEESLMKVQSRTIHPPGSDLQDELQSLNEKSVRLW